MLDPKSYGVNVSPIPRSFPERLHLGKTFNSFASAPAFRQVKHPYPIAEVFTASQPQAQVTSQASLSHQSAYISRHITTFKISASLTTPTAPAFRQVKHPYPIAEVFTASQPQAQVTSQASLSPRAPVFQGISEQSKSLPFSKGNISRDTHASETEPYWHPEPYRNPQRPKTFKISASLSPTAPVFQGISKHCKSQHHSLHPQRLHSGKSSVPTPLQRFTSTCHKSSISTTSTSHKSSITIPQSACISRHIKTFKISHYPPERLYFKAYQDNQNLSLSRRAPVFQGIKTFKIFASLAPRAPAFRQHSKSMRHDPQSACI